MGIDRSDRRHVPVMAAEVVRHLVGDPRGAYLDLTVGTGGHLAALAARLHPSARLYGLDRDESAVRVARARAACWLQASEIVRTTYVDVDRATQQFPDRLFNGALLDLGLSTQQLDDPDRGFSFQTEGPLDMRFDRQSGGRTAAELLHSESEQRLAEIIRTLGEQGHATRLARAIVRERQNRMIATTSHLASLICTIIPPPLQHKACARVFQALRIAVNDELEALQQVLPKALVLLKAGGRLAVIAYHSLEDRIVKRFLQREAKDCLCPPEVPQCVCGHTAQVTLVTRRPLVPAAAETKANPRARSAKLRVAERVGG